MVFTASSCYQRYPGFGPVTDLTPAYSSPNHSVSDFGEMAWNEPGFVAERLSVARRQLGG